jgi:hypothetical protein
LYCGESDHKADNYPKKQHRHTFKMRSATTSRNSQRENGEALSQSKPCGWTLHFKTNKVLSSCPTFSLLYIPLRLGSQILKILNLLDFGAFACFLDGEFTRLHKIPIVKKLIPIHIEVIDR